MGGDCESGYPPPFWGTAKLKVTQHAAYVVVIWVKIFKTEKTIGIQIVRLNEVCGKVLSGKNE